MAYPYTETGQNMYDMLSMMQKAIRRGLYREAGWAANHIKGMYRGTMWNRLLVISAEDCFGVITKEIVHLCKADKVHKDDGNISNAVALLCKARKNRDACYFACNFVLASRKSAEISVSDNAVIELKRRLRKKSSYNDDAFDEFGFYQTSIFDQNGTAPPEVYETGKDAARLQIAFKHRDMDMIGYEIDTLRMKDRSYLWEVLEDYAEFERMDILPEIKGLRDADDIVNSKKKNGSKDEIFVSKAAVLICHREDPGIGDTRSCEIIRMDGITDWNRVRVLPISECQIAAGIPEWVYDCHTLKGKRMGKTDWDMTLTEQAALHPLQEAYFDHGSWIYTYEQDFQNGDISREMMEPIWKYATDHRANPVEHLQY